MSNLFTTAQLEAYLDESLPDEQMTAVEVALRDDPALTEQLAALLGRRDAGVHSVGAIWRRHRLSCPSREQLGSFLLEVLPAEHTQYVRFHVETIGCRFCGASVEDLRQQHAETDLDDSNTRREKYFQTSAGYLSEQKK
jgi:hypothetical protein